MRDILFKAKSINYGEWVEGSLVILDENDYRIATENDISWSWTSGCDYDGIMTEVDENTVCQYTGLTDKNGNKIWENDVVKVDVDRAISMYSEKHSGYILQPIGDYYFDSPMLVDNVDIIDKVIGNIFDNPELLSED